MTNASQPPDYLSAEQAAQRMGLAEELVQTLCDKGVCTGLKFWNEK